MFKINDKLKKINKNYNVPLIKLENDILLHSN